MPGYSIDGVPQPMPKPGNWQDQFAPRPKRGNVHGLQPNPGFYDPNGGRVVQDGMAQLMPNLRPPRLKTPADLYRDEQGFHAGPRGDDRYLQPEPDAPRGGNQYLQPLKPAPNPRSQDFPAFQQQDALSPSDIEMLRQHQRNVLRRSLLAP